MISKKFEPFGSILTGLKFSLEVFEPFFMNGCYISETKRIWKTDLVMMLLKLSRIKYAKLCLHFS